MNCGFIESLVKVLHRALNCCDRLKKGKYPSPDRNGILFCCGRSKAEAVTIKIEWRAGLSFLKKEGSLVMNDDGSF
jgi:hypothetical protein